MKYIRIRNIKTLMGTKGFEPGKLVEKSTIDHNKIKKIDIKNILGQSKQLLLLIDNADIYIVEDGTLSTSLEDSTFDNFWCPPKGTSEPKLDVTLPGRAFGDFIGQREGNEFIGKSNWEFSKTAYENKYKGIQLELSGRLRGAQRARKMVKKVGSLSKQSFSSKLNFSKRNIYTKWGILGLKVYLNK